MFEKWWGRFALPPEGALRWSIGPLEVSLQAEDREWILSYRYAELNEEQLDRCAVSHRDEPLAGDATVERYVTGEPRREVLIRPALADRPVVSRPQVPFRLLPQESVELYVGSPLWFRVQLPDGGVCLRELPINRPSDTWFGASTRHGELCYATRTRARLTLGEIPVRPHRAVTPVTLSNRGEDQLLLERISLPVRLLAGYAPPGGNVWTNGLRLERRADRESAELSVVPGPPAAAAGSDELFRARDTATRSAVLKTLTSLLG